MGAGFLNDTPQAEGRARPPACGSVVRPPHRPLFRRYVHDRGELSEATAWSGRIDATSHWVVVLSASALSFVFSDPGSGRHILILIISMFCTFLLLMEARRYRFFDIWRSRVRLIEMNFYRPLLEGTQPPLPNWADRLAHDLEWPRFHLPRWEAAGQRLRRNDGGIYSVLLGG